MPKKKVTTKPKQTKSPKESRGAKVMLLLLLENKKKSHFLKTGYLY